MHFRHPSITAVAAGLALLTSIVAGPVQAQQEAPTQGPHSAPNTQNLDSNGTSDPNRENDTQNLDSNEASDSNQVNNTRNRNSERVNDLIDRKLVRENDFFVRGDRASVLVPRGPHGAYFPLRTPGFGGPDFLGGSSNDSK